MPLSGAYTFSSTTSGAGGSYVLLVDESPVITGSSGGTLSASATLTPGLHCVKVRSTSATAMQVAGITLSENGAPSAPTLASAVYTQAECALTWSAVAGAAGYTVAYGNTPGAYTSFVNAGTATSAVISGLSNSQVYYFAVYAYDASGHLSLFSNELRAAARTGGAQLLVTFEGLTQGTTQNLWSFGNMNFTAFGNTGSLQIQGPASSPWPGNWLSNILWSVYWDNQHSIAAANGAPFDLYSLDLADYNAALSARITGYDASGSSFSRVVNFSTWNSNDETITPVTLDWTQVVKVVVSWSSAADGANAARFGGIDNVLFNKTQAAAATPTQLAATALSGTQTALSWNSTSSPGGFIIDRATSSDFTSGLTSFVVAPGGGSTLTDGTVALSGTNVYYYRVRALSGLGESANSATSWVAPAGLPPLMLWRLNQFGRADSSGPAANLASPSGDGMSNLMKYALGGNPTQPDAARISPGLQLSAGPQAQFRFRCNAASSDIAYHVQASTDLATWTTIATSSGGATTVPLTVGTTVNDPGGTGLRTVTVTDGGFSGGQRRFLRLQITSP